MSYNCKWGDCNETFSYMPDFVDHVKLHAQEAQIESKAAIQSDSSAANTTGVQQATAADENKSEPINGKKHDNDDNNVLATTITATTTTTTTNTTTSDGIPEKTIEQHKTTIEDIMENGRIDENDLSGFADREPGEIPNTDAPADATNDKALSGNRGLLDVEMQ